MQMPTRTNAKAQPMRVIFFQSEARAVLKILTVVPPSIGSKVTFTVFLAVLGNTPQSDP